MKRYDLDNVIDDWKIYLIRSSHTDPDISGTQNSYSTPFPSGSLWDKVGDFVIAFVINRLHLLLLIFNPGGVR